MRLVQKCVVSMLLFLLTPKKAKLSNVECTTNNYVSLVYGKALVFSSPGSKVKCSKANCAVLFCTSIQDFFLEDEVPEQLAFTQRLGYDMQYVTILLCVCYVSQKLMQVVYDFCRFPNPWEWDTLFDISMNAALWRNLRVGAFFACFTCFICCCISVKHWSLQFAVT